MHPSQPGSLHPHTHRRTHLNRPVGGARDQPCAVVGEGHAVNEGGVAPELLQHLARPHAVDAGRLCGYRRGWVSVWLGGVCVWMYGYLSCWLRLWLTPSKEAVASWRESREKAIEVMPVCALRW